MDTPAYHREQLKAAIRMAHGSLLAFERAKGLPRNSVKDVLRGRAVSRAEQAIAALMDQPLHKLFPRRYGPRADSKSTKVDNSAANASTHRQNAKAA